MSTTNIALFVAISITSSWLARPCMAQFPAPSRAQQAALHEQWQSDLQGAAELGVGVHCKVIDLLTGRVAASGIVEAMRRQSFSDGIMSDPGREAYSLVEKALYAGINHPHPDSCKRFEDDPASEIYLQQKARELAGGPSP